MSSTDVYPVSERNKARRMRDRASYDVAAVHALLDSAMLCHIAYLVEGQPYCTPTLFWRRGNQVIWHGSVGSRMLREHAKGIDVCLTVTHLDSFVLTRSAFAHSVNYRSAMLFGKAHLIEDPEEKRLAARDLLDTFFPGRSDLVVPPAPLEVKQASFLKMEIEQASLKVRALPASFETPEYRHTPVWAGQIPIETRALPPVPCETLNEAAANADDIVLYREGGRLDATLAKIRKDHPLEP
jgi:nitroimidazol reductase NimA-like FMN-containing flavoprotein (pyridoxamine 5'-phosphate oxidase superfamily)